MQNKYKVTLKKPTEKEKYIITLKKPNPSRPKSLRRTA